MNRSLARCASAAFAISLAVVAIADTGTPCYRSVTKWCCTFSSPQPTNVTCSSGPCNDVIVSDALMFHVERVVTGGKVSLTVVDPEDRVTCE